MDYYNNTPMESKPICVNCTASRNKLAIPRLLIKIPLLILIVTTSFGGCGYDEPEPAVELFVSGSFSYVPSILNVRVLRGDSSPEPTWEGAGEGQRVEYSITNQSLPEGVSVDPKTGVVGISSTVPVGEYIVIVAATGIAGYNGSESSSLTVIVSENPIQGSLAYRPSTLEVVFQGEPGVSSPAWEGVVLDQYVEYSIMSVPANEYIRVDKITGIVSVDSILAPGVYSVTVTATGIDGFEGMIAGTLQVVVAAQPIAGSFSYSDSSVKVVYGSQYSSLSPLWEGQIDEQTVEYSVVSSPMTDGISVDRVTGVVVGSLLPAGSYTIEVTATGSGNFSGKVGAEIILVVGKAPLTGTFRYDRSEVDLERDTGYSSSIPIWENSLTGATVGYTLTSTPASSAISVNSTSGVVAVSIAVASGSYQIVVTATGNGNYSGSTTATIRFSVAVEQLAYKQDFDGDRRTEFSIGDAGNDYLFTHHSPLSTSEYYARVVISDVTGETIYYTNNVAPVSVDIHAVGVIGIGAAMSVQEWSAIPEGSIIVEAALVETTTRIPFAEGSVSVTRTGAGDIRTWLDLQAMQYDLDGVYTVKNDIEFPNLGRRGYDRFNSIGRNSDSAFTGSLDGGGMVISNISLNQAYYDNIGVFGYVKGGTIKNLTVDHIEVAGRSYVGAIAGVVDGGRVENCAMISSADKVVSSPTQHCGGLVGYVVDGFVSGFSTGRVSGGSQVGGLVGKSTRSVVQGYSNGTITGSFGGIGGLVGLSENMSEVTGYATGRVSGTTNVGGLIGVSNNSTTIGYSTGAISGSGRYVGGVIGQAYNVNSTGYSTGDVTGAESVGGFIGSKTFEGTTIGYSRGKVIRSGSDTTKTTFGLSYGEVTGVGEERNYHSSSESVLVGILESEATGAAGTPVTMEATTGQDTFATFVFGELLGQWQWLGNGTWPTLNISDVQAASHQLVE